MKDKITVSWLALFLIQCLPVCGDDLKVDWPRWRGPDSSGSAMGSDPPIKWSETENLRWKIKVPGLGSSTPIILGNRIYVATAVKTERLKEGTEEVAETADAETSGNDQRGSGRRRRSRPAPSNYYAFMVLAYDRTSGGEVWRTTVTEQVPHEAGHNTNTFASASPVTDGERIYVSFGSRGVYCLDMNGKSLWNRNLGTMQTRAQFGEGSSAALHDGTLVVPFDHEGESFIVALDAKSGEEKWRTSRDERTTWSTPLITEYEGRTQVITNGQTRVRSYDLANGELIWECGGQKGNPIPSPVRFEDNVIVMTGFRGFAIYSIPLDSKGDITDSDKVTWNEEDAAPYVPSPVLYQGQLYFVKSNNAVLVARDAKTGKLIIDQTRLPKIRSVYASPVAAQDRIYLTGRDGTTLVLKHGTTFEVLATNKLDEEIDASAAIVDDEIFLRGKEHLYCIAK